MNISANISFYQQKSLIRRRVIFVKSYAAVFITTCDTYDSIGVNICMQWLRIGALVQTRGKSTCSLQSLSNNLLCPSDQCTHFDICVKLSIPFRLHRFRILRSSKNSKALFSILNYVEYAIQRQTHTSKIAL